MRPMRQGDVILIPVDPEEMNVNLGEKLPHLILAEGEVTGHRHQISQGQAVLYQRNGTLYLKVLSKQATLTHEEHKPIQIPQGMWMVKIQREYDPQERAFAQGWRSVAD